MAEYYVDSATGSNADNGTTQALAWATIEYALESGGLAAGDNVWVRRGHSEIPITDIIPAYDGAADSPISVIGWPRASIPNTTITEATWTNGSTTVDLVVGVSLARTSHQGRFATAPDGKKYLITRIVDANTLIIDREYVGVTVLGVSGLFAINEDDDYASRPSDVDGWDSDADTLALIDCNTTAVRGLYLLDDDYFVFKNLQIKNSTIETVFNRRGKAILFVGCLISSTRNGDIVANKGVLTLKRTIIEGSGSGTSQVGLSVKGVMVFFKDGAIYNCGDNGLRNSGTIELEKVNIGVEISNGDEDISLTPTEAGTAIVKGKDVVLGGSNGYVLINAQSVSRASQCLIENYQKILGDHKTWFAGGTWSNVDVGDVNTPSTASTSGNTSDLIEILPNTSGYEFIEDWAVEVFVHEFEATTDSKTYTYYLQNNLGVTINVAAKDNLWLKAEYVDAYDDTSKYHFGEVFSAETSIAQRLDDTDWDSLSVTVQPAVASKVRITCYISKYVASGGLYIDPLLVIT